MRRLDGRPRWRAGTSGVAAVWGAALATLLFLQSPAVSAAGQQTGGASRVGSDLETERARVATLEAELERLASERRSIVRDIETIDVQLTLRRQQLAALEGRGATLETARKQQVEHVAALEAQFGTAREALKGRVAALYRMGPLTYNRLLFASGEEGNVLTGYQIATYMAERDRLLAERARETLAQLDGARESLTETGAELSDVRQLAAEAAVRLEGQIQARRRLLANIDAEADAQRAALEAAARSSTALEATLTRLSYAAPGVSGAAFNSLQGNLPWPAIGRVLRGFGRQRHPIYNTYTQSTGIEIEAAIGDPVVAVATGTVEFADWHRGYGLLVIVNHGDGYRTLYGHLSAVTARVHDRVQASEEIARAGETGSLSGPNLYFELREGNFAVNPTAWLSEANAESPD